MRVQDGRRQYFARRGYPDRSDGYFTASEISESEYDGIDRKYPHGIVANREKAQASRDKYAECHTVITEGRNKLP